MGKVQFVQSARKEWKCGRCGAAIEKGMSYYRGEVNFGPTFVRCTKCKLESWEVTSSDYQREVGEIVYRWKQNYGVTEDTIDAIVSDLETIRDDCQDKLDNMPEGLQEGEVGQLLSDRIDQLDAAIDDLGNIDPESDVKDSTIDEFLSAHLEIEGLPGEDRWEWLNQHLNADDMEELQTLYEDNLADLIQEVLDEIEV